MKKADFKKLLDNNILIFDGAMGTMLQRMGLKTGQCPEAYNIHQSEILKEIHQQYINAGCNIIQTNTFGASRIKLSQYGLSSSVKEINQQAVLIAKKASQGKCLVAGDIGPVGKLIYPTGELGFEEAYEVFYEQAKALIDAGVDLINIETMSDIQEAKAAVIAAKDAGDVPIICSMTFEKQGRTLTGTDPETAATTLEALGVDVIGVNCGFGPDMMIEIISKMYQISDCYLIAQPNAGLPRLVNGQSVFNLTPEDMAKYVDTLVAAGVNVIGGCCGTTPEHIKRIASAVVGLRPLERNRISFSKLASGVKTVVIDSSLPTSVIGECINPTAKKYLARALKENDMSVICEEALKQVKAGAHIIDVNVGIKLEKESDTMRNAILEVQRVVDLPLSIDTIHTASMEEGLKIYRGKPLINSTNGEDEFLDQVILIAKRYGASILGLTLDSRGIPETAVERLKIAEKIVERALNKGMRKEDIFIDSLVLTAGAQQNLVLETLKTIRLVKEELGVKTILGVSNISHGLPNRSVLNSAFLSMAIEAGLDLPIINPYDGSMWAAIRSADVITGRDLNARRFIEWSGNLEQLSQSSDKLESSFKHEETGTGKNLVEIIKKGDKKKVIPAIDTLKHGGAAAIDIINQHVIPALEVVGDLYEKQVFFLPQLLLAAETAQLAFENLKDDLAKSNNEKIGTIVIATVKGDIHDIGKNIVSIMMQNHGFRVIDLGKDVSTETIVKTAVNEKADIIGLSSLMTTTMPEMKRVIEQLKHVEVDIPVLVGGAVVTSDYAESIGAYYASDAIGAVKLAKEIISQK